MNRNNFILRLAFEYGKSKGNSSGPYRDRKFWKFVGPYRRGPYRDGETF